MRIYKPSLPSRDEQILIARRHITSLNDARNSLNNIIQGLKSDLAMVKFDDDIEKGLWSLHDNSFHVTVDIDNAINGSEISELYLDDERAEMEQNERDYKEDIARERSVYLDNLI